jgi:hypothetical protein
MTDVGNRRAGTRGTALQTPALLVGIVVWPRTNANATEPMR